MATKQRVRVKSDKIPSRDTKLRGWTRVSSNNGSNSSVESAWNQKYIKIKSKREEGRSGWRRSWEREGNDSEGGSEAAAEGDGVATVAGPWERERERERERRKKEKERVLLRGSEWGFEGVLKKILSGWEKRNSTRERGKKKIAEI